MCGLHTPRATQIYGCWGILMHRKCNYMTYGGFMKGNVLHILPGEVMLAPKANFQIGMKRVPIDAT